VAISTSGKIIVGKSFRQAVTHALEKLGKGNFVFKIGNQAVVSFWQAQAFKFTIP
jgi:hypothetical protein